MPGRKPCPHGADPLRRAALQIHTGALHSESGMGAREKKEVKKRAVFQWWDSCREPHWEGDIWAKTGWR